MKRVFILLILTLACAFGSYTSFMSNDYGPLKHWMAYYKEYKEIQGALDKGNASKAELLAKLKAMYPEKADQIEAQFKAKYGNLKDSAEDAGDTVKSKWDSYTRDDSPSRSRSQSQSQIHNGQSSSRTSQIQNSRSSQNSNHANDRDHKTDGHDNNRVR
ncbi:hypothetical protein LIQ46_01410 [Megasphaera elsdenii]|uniref:hypothetical protein n=1 Tax=Megasphaera elsdenii TaxID=907 RepID=UPI001D02DE02|nr:hypothetical protein [Megasphaera elsdenii]MCB5701685.1 hypothetical protein [Megasphaera elsdenii]MCB5726410.1 hypothetical protein [Megasphaera elsdenii]MCB5770189.1 hypothetical protein [Megasphaera elsdenii]